MKKIIVISDTHKTGYKDILPKGDILIHAGDFDIRDEFDLNYELNYFQNLDFKHIIFIGGNHDLYLEQLFKADIKPKMPKNIYYLCNDSIEIEGIKFWGSPFSPVFGNWAFMDFLPGLRKIWNTIPKDIDIVITHCPPFGINDQVKKISQGCPALRDKLKEIKPKYHICGHIHCSRGIYQDKNTIYINTSLLDDCYQMVYNPIEIEYE
jgi:Icc-related predicted phosphoesterase